jgi:hypothetical protein
MMLPLRSILRGVESSAVGTLAMDALLYRRYRAGGGKAAFGPWETSDGVESWDDAPAPALVAKRVLETVTRREVPPRYARSLNNVMHWGFGLGAGAAYGTLAGSRRPGIWWGPPFGAAVWAGGYVVLPLLGVYQPIWTYDRATLAKDLSAHLVFGTTTAATYWLLTTIEVDR